MKQKPRWTLEMLIAALAVLCALLTLALLVQRPGGLACAGSAGGAVGHRHLRFPVSAAALDRPVGVLAAALKIPGPNTAWNPLSQPAALLSGETVLWYNSRFRTALLGGEDRLAGRARKLLPGLDTAQARTPAGASSSIWPTVCGMCTAVPCRAAARA